MNNPPDTVSHSADNRLPYVLPIGETATHGRKATPTGDEKRQNAALPVHNIPAPEADQAKYLQIHPFSRHPTDTKVLYEKETMP